MIRSQEDRQALKAAKRAEFLKLKERADQGRLIPEKRKGFTGKQRRALYEAQRGLCARCGEELGDRFEINHVLSLFLGGKHEPANWEALHVGCHAEITKAQAADHAKARRLEDIELHGRPPGQIRSRGFAKITGKRAWGKRPFASRKKPPPPTTTATTTAGEFER